jgi:hypothetical protein
VVCALCAALDGACPVAHHSVIAAGAGFIRQPLWASPFGRERAYVEGLSPPLYPPYPLELLYRSKYASAAHSLPVAALVIVFNSASLGCGLFLRATQRMRVRVRSSLLAAGLGR